MASTTAKKTRRTASYVAPPPTEIRKGRKRGAAVAPSARPRASKDAAPGAGPPPEIEASKRVISHIPGTDVELVDARLAALLEPINTIAPDPANPRRPKNLAALVAFMRRYGYSDPIVVSSETRIVEAGHQRLAAVTSIGATHVPVLWSRHGQLDAAGFNIGHNRASEIVAEWDDDALRKILGALRREDEAATADLGWSDAELEKLLGEFSADEQPFPDLSMRGSTSDLKLRTFTLSVRQGQIVEQAVEAAKARGALWNPDANNSNGNANALTAICGLFLGLDVGGKAPAGDD